MIKDLGIGFERTTVARDAEAELELMRRGFGLKEQMEPVQTHRFRSQVKTAIWSSAS
jgi:hypothetical protein